MSDTTETTIWSVLVAGQEQTVSMPESEPGFYYVHMDVMEDFTADFTEFDFVGREVVKVASWKMHQLLKGAGWKRLK